jgi:hypothetical protein
MEFRPSSSRNYKKELIYQTACTEQQAGIDDPAENK